MSRRGMYRLRMQLMIPFLAEDKHSVSELLQRFGATGTGASGSSVSEGFKTFLDTSTVADLLVGYGFALLLAAAIAWHPKRMSARRADRLLGREGILLLLGLIGATVALLVMVHPSLGLVVFGIGGLVRFRTTLDDPELTAKGIVTLVIGLACGTGAYLPATIVAVIAWALVWFIDNRATYRVQIGTRGEARRALTSEDGRLIADIVRAERIHIVNSALEARKNRLSLHLRAPADLDEAQILAAVKSALPKDVASSRVRIELV